MYSVKGKQRHSLHWPLRIEKREMGEKERDAERRGVELGDSMSERGTDIVWNIVGGEEKGLTESQS